MLTEVDGNGILGPVGVSPVVGARGPGAARSVLAAVCMDAGGIMPIGLLGALAVQIRADLGLSVTVILGAVSVFFLSGAGVAAVAGPEIDRWGWRRSARASAWLTTASLLFIGTFVHSWWGLVPALAVGGAGLAVTMPSTNVLLFRAVSRPHLAMAISTKQSAVPAALILAGAAVPAVALTIGWRWAFIGAAGLPFLGLLLAPRVLDPSRATTASRASGRAAQRRVARVGLSVLLASLLPGALTGSCVITLVAAGMAPATAGLLFAGANVTGITVRLIAGWIADRSGTDGYRAVAAFMIVGGVGAALLATTSLALLAVATLIAFAFGWGWPGLIYFMAVRTESGSPGSSSAVMQTGGMLGSGLGLILVGLVHHFLGLESAWLTVAAATVGGGIVVAYARRRVSRDAASAEPLPAPV
ncbi:MAG: hypothetical protein NVS3B24_01810 [Candidatus Dormibacteria bacterium]